MVKKKEKREEKFYGMKVLAVVGATFAYFTATVQDNRTGDQDKGKTSIETAKVASKTIVANSGTEAGKFTATEVYPGHKEIAAIKVTVEGTEGDTSAIAIKYNVTQNGLYDDATITVYGLDSSLSIGEEGNNYFECEKKTENATEGEENAILYYEDCKQNEEKGLEAGKKLTEKTNQSQTVKIPQSGTLTFEDIIPLEATTKEKYYYVVIEYENDDSDKSGTQNQNEQMSQTLEGTIEVSAA